MIVNLDQLAAAGVADVLMNTPSATPEGRLTDPYRVIASRIFGVPESEVTDEQRREAKSATYFYVYSTPINRRSQ